jgi:type IV pilus assembly protein PilE
MNNPSKPASGFTLVELMIAVAIVGILAAIAYPSYVDSVRKGRRNDGMNALLQAAQKLEVYRSRTGAYTTNATAANIAATSAEGYYGSLTIMPCEDGDIAYCYSISVNATSKNDQDQDHVTTYRINSSGLKDRFEDGNWTTGWK